MTILIINGPNINLLGIREPDIYGTMTYSNLCNNLHTYCKNKEVELIIKQSNHEGDIIDYLQETLQANDLIGVILNAGGYTHTSYAIMDAIKAINTPVIEVHLSDTDKREAYRKNSIIREACIKTYKGEGINSYYQAINFLLYKE